MWSVWSRGTDALQDIEEAVALAAKAKPLAATSPPDRNAAATFVREAAPMHGRILVLDRECAKESTGHGSPCRCWFTVGQAGRER